NGGIAANRLAREADLLIAVGTRLGDFATASKSAFRNPEIKLIAVNVASRDAVKMNGLALVGDAKLTLGELRKGLDGHRTPEAYEDQIEGLKAEWDRTVDGLRALDNGPLAQSQVIGLVNQAAGGQ